MDVTQASPEVQELVSQAMVDGWNASVDATTPAPEPYVPTEAAAIAAAWLAESGEGYRFRHFRPGKADGVTIEAMYELVSAGRARGYIKYDGGFYFRLSHDGRAMVKASATVVE
jgi:hypothetical protein